MPVFEKGQATRECLPFARIIGVDPSAKMLEEARKVPKPTNLKGELEYVHSGAEKLPFLEDGSVDLIVSGKSLHSTVLPRSMKCFVLYISPGSPLVRLEFALARGRACAESRRNVGSMGASLFKHSVQIPPLKHLARHRATRNFG